MRNSNHDSGPRIQLKILTNIGEMQSNGAYFPEMRKSIYLFIYLHLSSNSVNSSEYISSYYRLTGE
jgi:hypothetical protein